MWFKTKIKLCFKVYVTLRDPETFKTQKYIWTIGSKDVWYFEQALTASYFPKGIIKFSNILSFVIKAKSNEKSFEISIT